MRHLSESNLALYASGDLGFWKKRTAGIHIARCADCRRSVISYRADQSKMRDLAAEMPEGVNWNRLAAEMTANIRVGLAAGECVAPRGWKSTWLNALFSEWTGGLDGWPSAWKVTSAVAVFTLLMGSAWWLNMPAAQTASLTRALGNIAHWRVGQGGNLLRWDEAGPLVEATAAGIEWRENGSALGVSQRGIRPASVTLSVQGSARARYIDSDTGQVTITSVYAQQDLQ